MFCSLYVSFSLLFFSRLFSSLLLEECVFESASQEMALDNSLLQGQGKCGFLSLPWGDHFVSSGYLWNHKLYRLLPIFKCGKKKETHSSRSRKTILCQRWNPNSLLTSRPRTRDNTTTTTTTREAHETATAAKQKQTVVRPSVRLPGTFHNIPTSATLCMREISVILSSQIDANLPT